jgi:hypothetical protein
MIEQRLYLEEFKVTSSHVGGDPNKWIGLRLTWESTQEGYGWGNDNEVTGKCYISVYGTEVEEWTFKCTLPEDSTVTVASYEFTFRRPTKQDKNRNIRFDTWMDTEVNGVDVIEKSITWNDVAPLTPLIWRVEDRALGATCLVEYCRGTAGYTQISPDGNVVSNTNRLSALRLRFSMGDWSQEVNPREGLPGTDATSHTYAGFTLPLDAATQLPNTTVGVVTVTLFSRTQVVGSNQEKETVYDTVTFNVTVPNNEHTRPAVSMALSPLSSLPSPYSGMYLQGHSRVKAALTFDTKYGASVAEADVSVNGKPYGAPYESDLLGSPGKVTVKATVKDSRGFTGTVSGEIEVIAYERPYIRAASGYDRVICDRCDAYANLTDEGKFLKIVAGMVYSKILSGGVQYNYGKIKFRYRKENGEYSDWSTILDTKTSAVDEVITDALLSGRLDLETNYQVQIVASDDLYETVPITFSISSDYVYMDRPAGGKSMGLGGYASGEGRLDVYWRFIARGGFSTLDQSGEEIPIDSSMPIPKGEISEGWSPDNLDAGVYVIGHDVGLSSGGTVIMQNGVLIQMNGIADGAVKAQIALPRDENASPKYRLCWFSAWDGWRDMKL